MHVLFLMSISGMTNTDVIWLHGDTEISTSDPFVKIVSHGNVHELHLPQTSETDSGVYACVLQNVCGRVHTYCNLCVKGNVFRDARSCMAGECT